MFTVARYVCMCVCVCVCRLENPLFRHLDIDSAKLRQAYPSVTELDIW